VATTYEVLKLIRIVEADTVLPLVVRATATRLRPLAAARPHLVLAGLERLRAEVVPDLAVRPPTLDYARCVTVQTFFVHNASSLVRASFATAADYRAYLLGLGDPATQLALDLSPSGLVTPGRYSWLLPYQPTVGLTAGQLKVLLNNTQDPPYVMFVFTTASLARGGVQIRDPRGIDAVPSVLLQWVPGNVPDEVIDGDLNRAALERIEWRA